MSDEKALKAFAVSDFVYFTFHSVFEKQLQQEQEETRNRLSRFKVSCADEDNKKSIKVEREV